MSDDRYMQRALELARLGMERVSPNPMVGCVIVHDQKIIGEGYHEVFGGPHAEVNAINAVINKDLIANATVYVTLEPCSHFGKTPPCADLLIEHKVGRVIICNTDPNPKVSGGGIQKLRDAGVLVEVGMLESYGTELNKRFFTAFQKKRPYVILKWAQTADSFIARENFDSKWISNSASRQLVHKWRAEEDAIMVGTNTARHDDPSLTTRDWSGKSPIRVVIDLNGSLDPAINLFDQQHPTICYTEKRIESKENLEFVQLDELTIDGILKDLINRGIHSVLVEGGRAILNHFITQNLWDEARVFQSTNHFGKGIKAPRITQEPSKSQTVLNDQLLIYKNNT